MKIAWGMTGAGHMLRESVELLGKMVDEGHSIDIFLSDAAEQVLTMYGLLKEIHRLKDEHGGCIGHIYFDHEQRPGFPVCAKFNLGKYDCLVLSPLSANSVAKIAVGIADTLITNIFSQMIKGGGRIIAVPCDLHPGELRTEVPGGDLVTIHIDSKNSQRALSLTQYPNTVICENPSEIGGHLCESKNSI